MFLLSKKPVVLALLFSCLLGHVEPAQGMNPKTKKLLFIAGALATTACSGYALWCVFHKTPLPEQEKPLQVYGDSADTNQPVLPLLCLASSTQPLPFTTLITHNPYNPTATAALEKAAKVVFCDMSEMEKALSQGADVNVRDENGQTLLHRACKDSSFNQIQLLITHNASLEARDEWGNTPLYYACQQNDLEIVQLLLKNGANVNASNYNGDTPLFAACYEGHLEVIRLLLKAGADVAQKDWRGNTVLHKSYQFYKTHIDVVKILLDADADFGDTNRNGHTPLYIAWLARKFDLVNLLIARGAPILPENITTIQGVSPVISNFLQTIVYWAQLAPNVQPTPEALDRLQTDPVLLTTLLQRYQALQCYEKARTLQQFTNTKQWQEALTKTSRNFQEKLLNEPLLRQSRKETVRRVPFDVVWDTI